MKVVGYSSILGLLAAPVVAQGTVWVVDDDGVGPGVDFADIQAAVSAASDGDMILVAEGTYRSFSIDGKSLVVTADQGADVLVQEPNIFGIPDSTQIIIQNLGAGQSVVIRGLTITPDPSTGTFDGTLFISNNTGDVLIEDCTSTGNAILFGTIVIGGTEGIEIVDSDSVALARSTFLGVGVTASFINPTGLGGSSFNSNVSAYDCEFRGGPSPGSASSLLTCSTGSTDAGDGFQLNTGSLFASGCMFIGGLGGDGDDAAAPVLGGGNGGPGGDGLVVLGSPSRLTTQDCTFVGSPGGAGGVAGNGTVCAAGPDGIDLDAPLGFVDLAGSAVGFSLTSPLREGEAGALSFDGSPGDVAFISFGPDPDAILLEGIGVLLPSPLVGFILAGIIGPGGTLDFPVSFGSSGPNDFRDFTVQGFAFTSEALVLTPFATLTILETGF